jgi:hypothetical protein
MDSVDKEKEQLISKIVLRKSEFDKISEELLKEIVPFDKLQKYYCFGYVMATANIVDGMKRVSRLSTDERVRNILQGLIKSTEESIQGEKSMIDMYNRLIKDMKEDNK